MRCDVSHAPDFATFVRFMKSLADRISAPEPGFDVATYLKREEAGYLKHAARVGQARRASRTGV